MSEEHDWIFDYVLQFLESERFDAEVMDFVDDNCEQFDSEEENKLVYTDIHQEFKRHIETLIESNLGALGISSEMFMDACEKGRHGRDINTVVFERMMAMDDFMTFKKIMVKRNTELQLEALQSATATSLSDTAPISPEQEKEQYRSAMRRSMRDVGTPGRDTSEETERLEQLALQNSLREMELRHKQEQVEQMELEQALALSLALEEERLRNILGQQEAERKLEQEIESEAKAASQIPRSGGSPGAAPIADAKMESKSSYSSAKNADLDSPTPTARARERETESATAPAATTEVSSSASASGSSSLSLSTSHSVASNPQKARDLKAEADRFEADLAARKRNSPSNKAKGPDDGGFAPPKPLSMRGDMGAKPLPAIGRGLGRGKPLPGINVGAEVEALESRKSAVEESMRKNRDMVEKQREAEESLRKQIDDSGTENAEDVRAQHMKEQRARILAAKKRERAEKVREEEARRDKEEQDNLASRARAQAFERAQAEKKAKEDKNDSGSPDMDSVLVEKRRSAMRMALARRMKMDMMEAEEQRFTQMQEDHFADLDKKLGNMEKTRRETVRRDNEERAAARRAQADFARNIAQSATTIDSDF